MKAVKGNEEFKQRVNLNSHAASVLRQDRENYAPHAPVAGFLNDIISGYYKTAKASIDIEVEKHRAYLKESLSAFMDTEAIIDKLAADYRKKLNDTKKDKSAVKGESILFRLNKANFYRLYGTDTQPGLESSNYDRPSLYLKALFEEFAGLPVCEREAFYFSQQIKTIQYAAKTHSTVNITLGNHKYLVRPYKILPDTGLAHLYLTGMSRPADRPHEDEIIVSFRISNLGGDVLENSDLPKRAFTRDDILDIEDRIRKNGVQYLIANETPKVKLRFHYSGEKMFRQKTHLRPIPVEVSQDGIYSFDCPPKQIANYFFSFGRNVEILEPERLRRDFMIGYQRAYDLYNTPVVGENHALD